MIFKRNDLSEPKAQRWRVIAEINTNEPDQNIALICLASSSVQIKENYPVAYFEVLTDEVKTRVKRLMLERFEGLPDCGHWSFHSNVPIPKVNPKKV